MRALIRFAQVVVGLLLLLTFMAAISQGRALIWIAHMQLIGAATTALLRYMCVARADPRRYEEDGWLVVLASCYGQEWRLEYRSWRVWCDDRDIIAALLTIPGMAWRHLWALVVSVETGVTGECPADW